MIKKSDMLNQQFIQELFYYQDGNLFWRELIGKRKNPVGVTKANGYQVLFFRGLNFAIHRLIWIYHYGSIPIGQCVSHINDMLDDNRLENLFLRSHKQSLRDRKMSVRNKSGCTGIYWLEKVERWIVQIRVDGKIKHLGYFHGDDFDLAWKARKDGEIKYGFGK